MLNGKLQQQSLIWTFFGEEGRGRGRGYIHACVSRPFYLVWADYNFFSGSYSIGFIRACLAKIFSIKLDSRNTAPSIKDQIFKKQNRDWRGFTGIPKITETRLENGADLTFGNFRNVVRMPRAPVWNFSNSILTREPGWRFSTHTHSTLSG